MELSEREKMLLELIVDGKKSNNDLMEAMHINGSDVRHTIMGLRRKGFPICSGRGSGYWLGSADDIITTINHLESRAFSMLETAKLLRRTIEKCPIKDSPFREICDGCYRQPICERVRI